MDQTEYDDKNSNDIKIDEQEEEKADRLDAEDGAPFWYVNKDSFPMTSKTWERMWAYVEKIHPDGARAVSAIRNNPGLQKVPRAVVPVFTPNMSVEEKVDLVQIYLKQLQYNHTGTQFFEIRKNRPLSGLMDTAKEIIKESLPIKCLEAVIVALYLTCGFPGLERFTISFKTQFRSSHYRHIVLGVCSSGKYGALGLSRRDDLMYKPLKFKSIADLIADFTASYNNYLHTVKKVKLSLPIVHDCHSCEKIQWKHVVLNPMKLSSADYKKSIERYSREIRTMFATYYPTSPRKIGNGVQAVSSNQQAKSPS